MDEHISFIPAEELIPQFCVSALSEVADWGLVATGIPDAHKLTKGAGITVAVIDTGYAVHPDLEGNVLPAIDLTGDNTNGVDGNGHGTHVAGIIAAAENDIGIIGVAPQAKILPIKVLDNGGHGGFPNIELGIRAAIAANVDIINLSLGAPFTPPSTLYAAVREAYEKGIVIVAAAGNDSSAVNWPAKFDEVIAVAALDKDGKMARFSSRGPEVDAGAPGVDIYSTYLNSQYALLKGTSQAAPFIAGCVALIKSWCLLNNHPFTGIKEALFYLNQLSDAHGRLAVYGDQTLGFGVPTFCNADLNKL